MTAISKGKPVSKRKSIALKPTNNLPSSAPQASNEADRVSQLIQRMVSGDPLHEIDDFEAILRVPLPKNEWEKFVREVQEREVALLRQSDAKADPKRCVVWGSGWKNEDGSFDHTWKGADDGKTIPDSSVKIVYRLDPYTGTLHPLSTLAVIAQIQLGIQLRDSNLLGFESAEERMRERLHTWLRNAKSHSESMIPSKSLFKLWQKPVSNTTEYKILKERYLKEESAHGRKRHNDRAHVLAQELQFKCEEILKEMTQPNPSREDWMQMMIEVIHAVRHNDKLLLVAQKGQKKRVSDLAKLRGGRRMDPFSKLVYDVCDKLYEKDPSRRPWPCEVFAKLNAKRWIDQFGNDFIIRSGKDPSKISKKAFDDARNHWASDRDIPAPSVRRPPKGMELPKPVKCVEKAVIKR
jgi:hypothetical protein